MSEPACVLDASAVLAILFDEPGADMLRGRLEQGCISTVNLAEVVAKLTDRGVPYARIEEALAGLDLDIRGFDHAQAFASGRLRPLTRSHGLSLGDRACLSLAAHLGAVAVTTDSAWANLDIGVKIALAR